MSIEDRDLWEQQQADTIGAEEEWNRLTARVSELETRLTEEMAMRDRYKAQASSRLQVMLIMAETLRSDAAFLRHYWEHFTVHVPVKDERGYVVNSFAAVQIPDWAVRQRLDDIDAAIPTLETK